MSLVVISGGAVSDETHGGVIAVLIDRSRSEAIILGEQNHANEIPGEPALPSNDNQLPLHQAHANKTTMTGSTSVVAPTISKTSSKKAINPNTKARSPAHHQNSPQPRRNTKPRLHQ
jgi:hypothetical protein